MQQTWTSTLVSATLAVTLAVVGLFSTTLYPGATPLLTTALLVGSLGATTAAFALVGLRVRQLELENIGLLEEVTQEFDRMKDKFDIFNEALAQPRSLSPSNVEATSEPLRRVLVK